MTLIRTYGIVGLLIMIIAEILMLSDVRIVSASFTPIVWTGYILFIDSLIFKLKGESLISSRPKELWLMLSLSIGFWLVFELYNVYIPNWHYINLYTNQAIRWFHYAWSFATIYPAIFQTTELLLALHLFDRRLTKKFVLSARWRYSLLIIGLIFLIMPPLQPPEIARYLWAPIWIGFIMLLEPVNYWLKQDSLLGDLEQGKLERMISLFVASYICGFLWEFWNYWAYTKWVYIVPFTPNVRIFEMPILGFLGFGFFALECHVVYNWAKAMIGLISKKYARALLS